MRNAKQRLLLACTIADQGGVQAFLLRFAQYLQSQGHEVHLAAGEGTWLEKRAGEQHIPYHRLRHLKRHLEPFSTLQAAWEFRTLLRDLQPDAIHLNSSKMGVLGSVVARATGFSGKIVYRIGGWVFLEPLPHWQKALYKTAERITARYKDTIVCVHPGDVRVAHEQRISPQGELISIPNGIDIASFDAQLVSREHARDTLELSRESFVFGTIANAYPAKNLENYLHAIARAAPYLPDATWCIVGDGPGMPALRELRATLHLEDSVVLAGAHEHASRYLQAFDAFVLPSVKEGMSWALLEAMAARLPCLATDVGAASWLLHDRCGWIAPAHDIEALAYALQEVVQQPTERSERAKRARKRIEDDFPLEKTLDAHTKLLVE